MAKESGRSRTGGTARRTPSKTTVPADVTAGQPPTPARSRRTAVAAPTEDMIRERAYHIYLARNGAAGDPNLDWQQAERELLAQAQQ